MSLKSSQLNVLTSDTYPLGIFLLFISFVFSIPVLMMNLTMLMTHCFVLVLIVYLVSMLA